MAMETLKEIPKQEMRPQLITHEFIEGIQDDEMEMEWKNDDLIEVLISPKVEEFEEAIIMGLIFEASNRFRENGVFLTNRAIRYLKEQGFTLNAIQNTDETTPPVQQVTTTEETIEEDAMDRNIATYIPQKRIIYSERKHKEARTRANLL